jgi:hypothetical protein
MFCLIYVCIPSATPPCRLCEQRSGLLDTCNSQVICLLKYNSIIAHLKVYNIFHFRVDIVVCFFVKCFVSVFLFIYLFFFFGGGSVSFVCLIVCFTFLLCGSSINQF